MLFEIFIIILSVSLDALSIGMAITLKGERVSKKGLLIVNMITVIMLGLVMLATQLITMLVGPRILEIAGAVLLIIIGAKLVIDSLCKKQQQFDTDYSKIIEGREAVILGIALSLDTAFAGFSLGNMGRMSVMAVVLAVLVQFLLYEVGCFLGRIFMKAGRNTKTHRSGTAAGGILIAVGLINLF